MLSKAEQNHLKVIYKLAGQSEDGVNTNDIAFQLEIKAASVTGMLRKLSSKKLINYEKYYGVRLTDKGQKLAIDIVRKHRLWEVFLSDKLGYTWKEVHDIAEELEHIGDEELINRLDKYLGFPKMDPHGDPIPGKNGKYKTKTPISISKINRSGHYVVSGFENNSHSFLQLIQKSGMIPGTIIKIEYNKEITEAFEIIVNRKSIFLSKEISNKIFVLPHD